MPSPEFQSWWDSFSRTGDICPLRLGMTRAELKAVLGEPDDVGGTSRRWKTPAILKYAELEFHFGLGPQGRLELIHRERDNIAEVALPRLDRE